MLQSAARKQTEAQKQVKASYRSFDNKRLKSFLFCYDSLWCICDVKRGVSDNNVTLQIKNKERGQKVI